MNKKHWDTLTDDEKWDAYEALYEVNKSHADLVHKIVNRLLGDGYYTYCSDVYGSNDEIWQSIKLYYSDVNFSFFRQLSKIKIAIKEFFKNGRVQ